jgi:enoyl-CoA hydratase/carnithine racemase
MEVITSGLVGLDLDRHGVPTVPMLTVDLDDAAARWTDDEIVAAADAVAHELPVTIGVGHTAPARRIRPLAEALTLSVVPEGDGHAAYVVMEDVDDAVAALATAVAAHPQASVALAGLLRVTSWLDVRRGLIAEAAMYSTLLTGPEFRGWLDGRDRRPSTGQELPVLADRHGDRLSITLNRPARHNALNVAMREALVEILAVPLADPTIAGIDLRGAGRSFCSGGDLDEFGMATDPVAAYLVRLDRSPWWLLHRLRDRTRVRVEGACMGAGLEMAAFAGFVSAAPDTLFTLPEVSMGLVPGAGGTVSVAHRIGRWRAAWMMITGERVSPETALDWGLVDEVVRE